MADSPYEQDLTLRVSVKIAEGGEVPALDTRKADAALDAFKERVIRTQREIAASTAAAASGAMSGVVGGGAGAPGGTAPYSFFMQPTASPGVMRGVYGPAGRGLPVWNLPQGSIFVDPRAYAPSSTDVARRPYGPYGAGADPLYGQGVATMLSGPWHGPDYYNRLGPGSDALSRRWRQGPGAAHGPISDPGSHSTASLQTSRGYSMAMIRQQLNARNQILSTIEQDGGGGFLQASRGLSQAASGVAALAAAVVMLNKAAEEGTSAWQKFGLQFGAGVAATAGFAQTARGGYGLMRGGASMAGQGVRWASDAALGAGMLGMSTTLARAAAPMGGLALLGAGAGVAAGAVGVGVLGYQLFDAYRDLEETERQGRAWDQRVGRIQSFRSMQQDVASQRRIGRMQSATDVAALRNDLGGSLLGYQLDLYRDQQSRLLNEGDFAGARRSQERQMAAVRMRSRDVDAFVASNDARSAQIGARIGQLSGEFDRVSGQGRRDDAVRIAKELERLEAEQARLAQLNAAAQRQKTQEMIQQLQAQSQLADLERSRARSAAGGVGRMTDRQWQRGVQFWDQAMADGALDDREARRLESLGFGGSAALQEFYRQRGQARTDEAAGAGRRGLLPPESRTSQEVAELEKILRQADESRQKLFAQFEAAGRMEVDAMERLTASVEAMAGRMLQLEQRLATGPLRGGSP